MKPVAVVLLALLAGCAAPAAAAPVAPANPAGRERPAARPAARPAWIESGQHPAFPKGQWLTGVGVAETGTSQDRRAAARARAREEIASTIRVRVESEYADDVQRHARMGAGTEEIQVTEDVRSTVKATTDGLLEVTRELDGFDDGTATWVLEGIAIQTLVDNLMEQVDREVSEAQRLRGTATASLDRAELGPALSALAHAERALLSAGAHQHTANLFTTGYDAAKDQALAALVDVGAEIARLGQALSVEKVGGDGQSAMFGERLAVPLVLSATSGGKPAAGLPVRFGFLTGKGRLDETPLAIGVDGRAACEVYLAAMTGLRENTVEAAIDLDALAGPDAQLLASGLAGRHRVEFVYYLPSRDHTLVAFDLEETFGTDPDDRNRTERTDAGVRGLSELLKAEGFALKGPGVALPEGPGSYAFTISGWIRQEAVRPGNEQERRFFPYSTRVRLDLTITDATRGTVLAKVTDKDKGLNLKGLSQDSYESAAQKYYQQFFAAEVAPRVAVALHGMFVGDAEELAAIKRRLKVR